MPTLPGKKRICDALNRTPNFVDPLGGKIYQRGQLPHLQAGSSGYPDKYIGWENLQQLRKVRWLPRMPDLRNLASCLDLPVVNNFLNHFINLICTRGGFQ
jgi:hypothetical protein